MTLRIDSTSFAGGRLKRVLVPAGCAVLLVETLLYAVLHFGAPAAAFYLLPVSAAGLLVSIRWVCRLSGLRAWGAYCVGFAVFAGVRSLADQNGLPVHFAYPADLDRAIFGALPTAWLQNRLPAAGGIGPLPLAMSAVYLSYYAAPHLMLYVLRHKASRTVGPCAAAMLTVLFAGLFAFLFVPTAPPWLAAETGALAPIHRVLLDTIRLSSAGSDAPGYRVATQNAVAAMPSIHVALTWVVAFAATRLGRAAGAAGLLYAAAMSFAVVYLGEHYAVDMAAGTALAMAAWQIVRRRTAAMGG
ncbi:MAG: phosphatase PAP2 family protein [Dehalococcoidia bacterium]